MENVKKHVTRVYKIEGSAKEILELVNKGLPTNEIVEKAPISRSAVYKHLDKLRRDGYIKSNPCTWEVTEYGKKFI